MHALLVRAVVDALQRIFVEGHFADKVIEQTLRANPKAGSRDRAFMAEAIYEIVRYYRLFSTILGKEPRQLTDFWDVFAIYYITKPLRQGQDERGSLPEWREFARIKPTEVIRKYQEALLERVVRESIPDWMDARGMTELGERWPATLQELNRPADVVLRVNTLRTSREQLQKTLLEEGIETEPVGASSALRLKQRKNVFMTKAFRAGHFELQDYSSQEVAPFLEPEPGMRVVDACAGGGGKSLHLAALMQNKGQIISLDTFAWKLDELKVRARRAGVSNIETRPIESNKVIKRMYGTADRLLLDVPCSGLGVLRRNPDSKWKLTEAQLTQLIDTQQTILQSYSPIVKSGGKLVYATCSILPSENRAQVDRFLASEAGKGWELVKDRSILPQEEGFDGFYMALLSRK